MINTYLVELMSTGAITQLPDSQKVFGALIYMFAEEYGSREATQMVKAIKEKNIHFSLSNVIPYGYVPLPQAYLIEQNQKLDLQNKKNYKLIKRVKYIKKEDIGSILNSKKQVDEVMSYVRFDTWQQLRASIDSIRYDMPELESKLYSVPVTEVIEVKKNGTVTQETPVKKFCFYMQVEENEQTEKLVKLLKRQSEMNNIMILGKRASQGMNTYEIQGFHKEKEGDSKGNMYLNMGMLLPDKISFTDSALELFTSERCSFNIENRWNSKQRMVNYISFVSEGSIIAISEGIKVAGKCVESPSNPDRDIVFGNAYLWPIKLNRGEV
ncbi:CRISPR type III-A-associated RAMP protein Csm4 [Aequitasia blattaphilus]|uniref:Uncharacterized protein n=1 Tax=Aequitasia blattaphilus TaxID=2949332 RepID=A0ABT1E8C1_9FIRM|nr:hypothetical protein [Aequitasia blattaphilus]MCP1102033.1 hypothetical protein [Aequitasia blattaphilus]MCR8614673.1 hypothetical protein [Aequitasia blattaphilus]